jgi:hypothetical protein
MELVGRTGSYGAGTPSRPILNSAHLELGLPTRDSKWVESRRLVLLVRRCACCERVFGPDGWQHLEAAAENSDERETATICPDCIEVLENLSLTR